MFEDLRLLLHINKMNQWTSFVNELQKCLLLCYNLLSLKRIWLILYFCLRNHIQVGAIAHSWLDLCREVDYGKHNSMVIISITYKYTRLIDNLDFLFSFLLLFYVSSSLYWNGFTVWWACFHILVQEWKALRRAHTVLGMEGKTSRDSLLKME